MLEDPGVCSVVVLFLESLRLLARISGEATRSAQKSCKQIACQSAFILFSASPAGNARARLGLLGHVCGEGQT